MRRRGPTSTCRHRLRGGEKCPKSTYLVQWVSNTSLRAVMLRKLQWGVPILQRLRLPSQGASITSLRVVVPRMIQGVCGQAYTCRSSGGLSMCMLGSSGWQAPGLLPAGADRTGPWVKQKKRMARPPPILWLGCNKLCNKLCSTGQNQGERRRSLTSTRWYQLQWSDSSTSPRAVLQLLGSSGWQAPGLLPAGADRTGPWVKQKKRMARPPPILWLGCNKLCNKLCSTGQNQGERRRSLTSTRWYQLQWSDSSTSPRAVLQLTTQGLLGYAGTTTREAATARGRAADEAAALPEAPAVAVTRGCCTHWQRQKSAQYLGCFLSTPHHPHHCSRYRGRTGVSKDTPFWNKANTQGRVCCCCCCCCCWLLSCCCWLCCLLVGSVAGLWLCLLLVAVSCFAPRGGRPLGGCRGGLRHRVCSS